MTRKKGIGQEDKMHMKFGLLMRQYEGYKKMPSVIRWCYFPAGEKRTLRTAQMLKKKGSQAGFPDYIFFVFDKKTQLVNIYFLEFKTETGKQQKTQQDFELAFAGSPNAVYVLVRSVEEAIKFLEKEEILITN